MSERAEVTGWSVRARLIGAAALALLALAVYARSFAAPFFFDDLSSVTHNPSLQHLWPLTGPLHPPADSTVGGRPLANLTLALNHTVGGEASAGYRVVNLLIHVAAGLTLWGLVRRTLRGPALRGSWVRDADVVAWVVVALWLVHPVQVATVSYVSQRTELLMAWAYLFTLYAFARSVDSTRAWAWQLGAVVACWAGAGCKEIIATAPLAVLLYDRLFVSESLRAALKCHWAMYAGMAASWLALAWLMRGLGERGIGTDTAWWSYARTECVVVVGYLRIALWPTGLALDHGPVIDASVAVTALCALTLMGLVAATIYGVVRGWRAAYAAAFFFLVLAPTSSVVPIAFHPMAENRLYLPLAAVVTLVVVVAFGVGRRFALITVVLALAALGGTTVWRNEIFRSELTLWQNAIDVHPRNARAHYNLAEAQARAGLPVEAMAEYRAALALDPNYFSAHNNLANLLSRSGQQAEAIEHYEAALKLRPELAGAHYNLADTLLALGRNDEALAHYAAAERGGMHSAMLAYNLGTLLAQAGRDDEARVHFAEAVRLRPDLAEAQANLANLLGARGETDAAIEHYEAALRAKPDFAAVHYNYGNFLLARNRSADAATHFAAALRYQPDFVGAEHNLALALVNLGRPAEALPHYEAVLRAMPGVATAHQNYAIALAKIGRRSEALRELTEAVRLQPSDAAMRAQLEAWRSGRW